jgi:hypothetical protein
MSPLPLEVHRAILRKVDSKRDLCAVARVSRLMRMEAEWLIYRDIELGKRGSARTVVLVLKHIISSTVLPLYVRCFALMPDWQITSEHHLASIFHLLSRVLQKMTRLRNLKLRIRVPLAYANLLSRCTFKLSIYSPLRFLESQPEIRILKLGSILAQGMPVASPSFLPNLATLVASRKLTAILVPRRPVTRVWLSYLDYQSLGFLALSSAPILALGICICWNPSNGPSLDTIVDLGSFAPDMEIFHVILLVEPNEDAVVRLYFLWLCDIGIHTDRSA